LYELMPLLCWYAAVGPFNKQSSFPSTLLQQDTTVYMFSNESGLLHLSLHALSALNVTVLRLDLPDDSPCFQSAFHRLVLASLAGYTVPLLNALVQAYGTRGAVKIDDQRGHHRIVSLEEGGYVWDTTCVHAA
jgi:hypothetical protein